LTIVPDIKIHCKQYSDGPWDILVNMSLFLRALSKDTIETSISDKKVQELQEDYLQITYTPELAIQYDAETELFDKECKTFMNGYVNQVFLTSSCIAQEDKARFGLLMQHPEGRCWFGKFIDTQRVNNQEVDEFVFYRLVQYFAVCLFECTLADDFAPATSIMNMSFTYYYTSSGKNSPETKQFVYEYLRDQPIWKSLRFWNAAFLVATHVERTKRTGGMQGWSSWDVEQRKDFEIGEENSAFAQLLQFLYMMKSLGVSKEDREQFLMKMSVISNLREEQVSQLEESVEII